jgi:hypothetical protein
VVRDGRAVVVYRDRLVSVDDASATLRVDLHLGVDAYLDAPVRATGDDAADAIALTAACNRLVDRASALVALDRYIQAATAWRIQQMRRHDQ